MNALARASILSVFSLWCGVPCLAAAPATPESAVSRGYTIPTVDLAGDKARQVIVDRESGQYLGHPTTVLLEDNRTMLIVYPKGHGRGGIVMKRSTDGGLTWSERLPTPENWSTSLEVPTLYRVVDPKRVKRLIMFSGLYPIRMASSDDDGASFTELKPIGEFGGIVAMAALERLKNGNYMTLFHDDGRFLSAKSAAQKPPVFVVYKSLSSDGGLTWSEPTAIARHPTAHLCEPGIIRSPDGKQLAVLLRENSRKHNSMVIFSGDEGETWSEPRELPGSLTGDRHVGRYAPDGRLFITFRDTTRESPTKGDWVGWVGTYDDIVAGREGQYRVRLMQNYKGADCAYPGLELLPDGTFVTTTYGHWSPSESPYIVSVRFKLADIDAKAKELQRLSWSQLPPLPDKIGFAGSLVGVSNGALIVGGGSNFPGKPVWEGGTKVWYDSAFVLDKPDGKWQTGFKLPRPLGYSVCISTTGGVYCIGGSDAERHYADTFKLTWRDGKLHHTPGPELPRPCANFCGAQVGNVIYVAGGLGSPNDTSTLKTFWSLDLSESLPKWKELEPWPGPARMLSTAAAIGDSFYLFSGVDLSAGADGKPVRHYRTDAYRYTPGEGWKRLADLPRSNVAGPSPAAVTKSGHVLFLGGDDGSLVYLPQKEHPGFPDTTLAYDVARDAWSITGMTPHPMAVTPLVEWHGGWILAGGELRPGIRTPQVWRVAE